MVARLIAKAIETRGHRNMNFALLIILNIKLKKHFGVDCVLLQNRMALGRNL